jgi:hypothetical protein
VWADRECVQLHGVVDAPVQRRAEGFGALGGVLGDVGSHRLGRQLPGPGRRDRTDIKLSAPAHYEGHGLVLDELGHRHRDPLGSEPHGLGQQLGREERWRWRRRGGVVLERGGVQADHRVEVDRTPSLVLGHLAEAHPDHPVKPPAADP